MVEKRFKIKIRPTMKEKKDVIGYKIDSMKTFILFILIMLFYSIPHAQTSPNNKPPLSQRAKQQIEKNIINSSDWNKLHELKKLNASFPSQRYQQQIDEIYETYRFTLVGSEFSQEQRQREIQQQNNKMLGTSQPPKNQGDPFYYNKQNLAKQQRERELYEIINSDKLKNTIQKQSVLTTKKDPLFWLADTTSFSFKNHLKHYDLAYNEIINMLSGKAKLNLKRAIFVTENAFYQNELSYSVYCKQIDELVINCKKIIKQNKLNVDNFMAGHFAIQTLFREKFGYDFEDYMGKDDYSKLFVTKLLETQKGQCHSLPLLYLILAEELNINAFLALAPNHSYIKFGNQNQSYNFETTNGSFVSDQWLVASGYISSTAVKNNIYLAPLDKKQVIAQCLVDLAMSLEFLVGKSEFTLKCANESLRYFPNNINSLLITGNYLVANCANTAKRYNFPKEDDYSKYPELKSQFDEMVSFETIIEQTGYIRIPPEQYELWQQTINEAKRQQEDLKFLNTLKKEINAD